MNKILKIAAYLAGAVILLLLVAIAYLQLALPSVDPAPELTIEYTPDRVERGAYLANHVTVCMVRFPIVPSVFVSERPFCILKSITL